MKGTREYCNLIEWAGRSDIIEVIGGGRYRFGNLLMSLDSHARGVTLEMFVVDDKFSKDRPVSDAKLKVYGAISGQLGLTETYGWLHEGKWQSFFKHMISTISERKEFEEKRAIERRKEIMLEQESLIQKEIMYFNNLF